MKKIIYLLLISVIAIGLQAQDKTPSIRGGQTYVDISFDASDTINESETYYIELTNKQEFAQMYDVWVDLDSVSGAPNVTTTIYGKKFTNDTYVSIGTAVTWAGTVDTMFNYPIETAQRYRFIKIEFVADATDQQSLISDVRVKAWNTGGSLSVTKLTDGIATLENGALSGVTTIDASGVITTTSDISVGDDVLLADGAVLGITGNEVITFNEAGSINFTGATVDIDGAFTASSVVSDGAVSGTTITGTAKISTTATTEQLRLNYDATNYATATVEADGALTFVTVDAAAAEGDINFNPDGFVGVKTAVPTVEFDVTGAGAFSTNLAVDGTSNLDDTDIDGTFTMDGTAFDVNSTSTVAIDNTNTTNGVTINTVTSAGVVSIVTQHLKQQ